MLRHNKVSVLRFGLAFKRLGLWTGPFVFSALIFANAAFAMVGVIPSNATATSSCTLTFSCDTNATHVSRCRRVGDNLCVEALSTYTGASNATTCTATLPTTFCNGSQCTINTSKVAGGTSTSNQGASLFGTGMWQDAGVAFKVIQFQYNSTTSVKANENPGLLQGSSMANGDSVKWLFCVPIVGW